MSPTQIKEENSKRRTLAKNFRTSKARTRLIKDPNAPKKPISAYLRFFTENYTPGASVQEAAKEASQRWKSMSETEKRVYPSKINSFANNNSHICKLMKVIKLVMPVKRLRMTRVELEVSLDMDGDIG